MLTLWKAWSGYALDRVHANDGPVRTMPRYPESLAQKKLQSPSLQLFVSRHLYTPCLRHICFLVVEILYLASNNCAVPVTAELSFPHLPPYNRRHGI